LKRPVPIIFAFSAAAALPLALALFLSLSPGLSPAQEEAPEFTGNPYEEFIVDLESGRPRPRSIENPQYIATADASLTLEGADVVFVIEAEHAGGRTAILPQRVMVHHEIANLEFDGRRISVVYSPLAGMVRGFRGRIGDRRTGFGATGQFVNSVRLIYDRATNSLWLPLSGMALEGPLAGKTLDGFPVIWTTWEPAEAEYPEARVLAGGALADANYTRDPYGSYLRDNTYYQAGGTYFPPLNRDGRLDPKDVVVVPSSGTPKVAFLKRKVVREKVVNVEQGFTRLAAFHDETLNTVNLFEPEAVNRELTFGYKNGVIFDHQTRSKWSPDGEAIEGRLRGRRLTRVESLQMFWFVWAGFYPESILAAD
jgi:hypothetical protein